MSGPYAISEKALENADFTAIADAILVAYPNKEVLYALLLRDWGVRVSDVIFVDQPGGLAVSALVAWARAQGRALDLLAVAWSDREREYRPIKELARRWIIPSFPVDEAVQPILVDAPATRWPEFGTVKSLDPTAPSPSIQSRRRSASEDLPPIDFMARMGGAICMVRVANSTAATSFSGGGTGFLIGRRTVLTTHSVAGQAIAAGLSGDRVVVTFDGIGSSPPFTTTGAAGAGWIGPWSDHAESDTDSAATSVGSDRRLDFAVIRLMTDAPPDRPIIRLPTQVPIAPPGAPVIILNHPLLGPLTSATGALIEYSRAGSRVTYDVVTEPGSAGAPVFTAEGDLIALHHVAGEWDGREVGRGVPIWRIRQAIVDAGLDPADL